MPESAPDHFAGHKEVRWGIIGCRDVTEVKSGPGFQNASGSLLTAVMRRNGVLAADYAWRHGVDRSYDSDAIYIATPPGSQTKYALMAAAGGKPEHVEKPMDRHTPECDQMVAAFRLAVLPLYAVYYRRRLRCL